MKEKGRKYIDNLKKKKRKETLAAEHNFQALWTTSHTPQKKKIKTSHLYVKLRY